MEPSTAPPNHRDHHLLCRRRFSCSHLRPRHRPLPYRDAAVLQSGVDLNSSNRTSSLSALPHPSLPSRCSAAVAQRRRSQSKPASSPARSCLCLHWLRPP
ncbi:hypothetical protein M0R45_013784 [Rubus argutus]|uniref:Uncharacterized protein n=1 Tax=Rubus argutus TaxID=59490 RepID=A0AAW1XJF5_RUBAR